MMDFTMDSVKRLTRGDSKMLIINTDKRTEEFIDEYDIIENGNCYIDQLLETLIGNAETDFNPYYLEDYILKTPLAKASLCNGRVTGLQSLHRAGNCFLTKTFRRLHVNAYIGATDVNIVYEVALDLKCLILKFQLNLHFGRIRMETHLSFFENSGRDATMCYFEIEDMDDMVPSLTIYKPLDWIFSKAIQATVWFFYTPIRKVLSNAIKRRIKHGLSSYEFPLVVVGRASPSLEKSSETTNSRYKGLYSQAARVESLADGNTQSVEVLKETSSECTFLSFLEECRGFSCDCEDVVIDEIVPKISTSIGKRGTSNLHI